MSFSGSNKVISFSLSLSLSLSLSHPHVSIFPLSDAQLHVHSAFRAILQMRALQPVDEDEVLDDDDVTNNPEVSIRVVVMLTLK